MKRDSSFKEMDLEDLNHFSKLLFPEMIFTLKDRNILDGIIHGMNCTKKTKSYYKKVKSNPNLFKIAKVIHSAKFLGCAVVEGKKLNEREKSILEKISKNSEAKKRFRDNIGGLLFEYMSEKMPVNILSMLVHQETKNSFLESLDTSIFLYKAARES